MSFLLDTNVPSELARPRPDAKVIAWLAAQDLNTLFLSVVTLGELRKGIIVMTPASGKTNWSAGCVTNCCTCLRDESCR